MPLPGFTSICDATKAGTVVSLLGAVLSLDKPREGKGKANNWFINICVQDDFSSGTIGTFSGSSIDCRLFRSSPTDFPPISGGDIVILRNFKLNGWNSRLDCISDIRAGSGVLVFPASKIPVPELSQAYQLGNKRLPFKATPGTKDATAQEQVAVINLKHSAPSSLSDAKHPAITNPFKAPGARKLSLIKDMDDGCFYDVRVQVVNTYYTDFGTVELKVTDYTSNSLLFLYADPDKEESSMVAHKSWVGPYGQLTLSVVLWGNNANWARENVLMGDFVFLKNMRTKMSPANKLEGVLHEDKVKPDQVDICKLVSPADIAEINERREAYEQQRTGKPAFQSLKRAQNEPEKPSAKTSAEAKQEKRKRQRLQKELEREEIEKNYADFEATRNNLNTNVVASHPDTLLSTISEIIHNPALQTRTEKLNDFTLPFVNCKHRARVRVVDFYPPIVEDFAHSACDPTWNTKPNLPKEKNLWEWGFVLLLEDAKPPPNKVPEKLRVVVNNDAGQFLLGHKAVNLKESPRILGNLEETLFILWGNLLELKTELREKGSDLPLPPGDNRLQNKPFECNIWEYGTEVKVTAENRAGYQRMHGLFETKIRT